MGMNYVERKKIHATLYNEMMSSVMRILAKLDLSASKTNVDGEMQVTCEMRRHVHVRLKIRKKVHVVCRY